MPVLSEHGTTGTRASSRRQTAPRTASVRHPSMPINIDLRLRRVLGYEEDRGLRDTGPPGSLNSHLSTVLSAGSIAEDALDVDDPRRNYDFAEFMTRWQYHYNTVDPTLQLWPGLQSGVKEDRASGAARSTGLAESDPESDSESDGERDDERDVNTDVESDRDVQGLRWKAPGPSRRDALRTRRQLHPSGQRRGYVPADSSTHEPRHYRFRAFNPKHRAYPRHFQLRNLLSATSRSEVFYSTGDRIVRTSLACPDVRTTVMDFSNPPDRAAPFRITCLATPEPARLGGSQTDSVLVVGGFSGEYAIQDLESEGPRKQHEGFITHDYNGIVNHIHASAARRSGLLQAAFSSNDRKIRIMDVKTQRITNTHSYHNAINCSAVSPDGRLRLLVGDFNEALVTNSDTGEVLTTLDEHRDHAFACAWSHTSHLVATGAQDGKVILWDARNWSRPLRVVECLMSCARSLHFTDHDLLVAAESEDVVSIYHPKFLGQRQDIEFFGSIAGVCLLDGGNEIAIANADQTVGGLLSFQRTQRSAGYQRSAKSDRVLEGCAGLTLDVFV